MPDQALERIDTKSHYLEALASRLNTGPNNYKSYLQAERAHLLSLKSEPPEVQRALDYMEKLKEFEPVKREYDAAKRDYDNLDWSVRYQTPAIAAIRQRHQTLFRKLELKEQSLLIYEEEHGITERWDPNSESYKRGEKLLQERNYRHAVDNLERLVVQRLFELMKLRMNGVGYKLREKISKALHARSVAIQTALKQYNTAASLLIPPREPLTWATVVQAATVADFDLLRDTRNDICQFPWTEPSRREATNFYFRIKRARKEIVHLNVEITRLLTFLYNTHVDYQRAICNNNVTDLPLASYLSREWNRQNRIAEEIVNQLVQTSRLHGFTGSLKIGSRVGRDPELCEGIPPPAWASLLIDQPMPMTAAQEYSAEDEIAREVEHVDLNLVVELIEQISMSS
uniref:Uncharacterized protein n=1 Tax=Psilocybe cubensis TaxID=181762 RepID=A0A8H8CMU1_PSICU